LLLSGVFLAVALVSGNNLSAYVGKTIGARILDRRSAKILGAAGVVSGFLIQGRSMAHAAQEIFPLGGLLILSEALFVTVEAFILAKSLKAPLSL
jgi:phosphate/sulfate permease